jgi:hypothetical protein
LFSGKAHRALFWFAAFASASACLEACFFELADPVAEAGVASGGTGGTERPPDGGVTGGTRDGGGGSGAARFDADRPADGGPIDPCFGPAGPPAGEPGLGVVTAEKFATAPEIDGDVQDWDGHARHSLAEWCADCKPQPPIPDVVDSSPPPADDLTAAFRLGWDAEFLYVLVEARDDDLVNGAAPVDAGALGAGVKQDAAELVFNADLVPGGIGTDDRQLFYGLDGSVEWPNQTAVPSLPSKHEVRIADTCYVIEVRIAWLYLNAGSRSTMDADEEIGFLVAINDWDRAQAGEAQRQSHLFSKNPGDGYWYTTDGYGRIHLAP